MIKAPLAVIYFRCALPFCFPLWIVGYPLYSYWSEFGRIFPTQADIHTPYAAWSDGLTLIPVVFIVSIVLGIITHVFLILFFLLKSSKLEIKLWLLGTVAGVVSTWLTLFLFGNLMDI